MRQIKLLGTLEITDADKPAKVMKYSKGCALLVYLLVTGEAQSREGMADLLWDATSTQQSLRNLRSLLHKIRPSLPELQVTRKQINHQSTPDVSIDLQTLEAGLSGQEIAALDDALALYRGELVSDFYVEDASRFNEWLLIERERLRQRVWAGYRRLCAAYNEQEAWQAGIAAARRWLALDPLDEEVQRQLIQLMVSDGQIAAAAKQFEACRETLWEELGVEPEPATAELGAKLAEMQAQLTGGFDWQAVLETQLSWPDEGEVADVGMLPAQARIPFHRNAAFIGRKPQLLTLADHLLPNRTGTTAPVRAMVVHGMGGLGKTQLAVEYAYRYGRYYPGGVYWLSFADPANIEQEIATVGEVGMRLYRDSDQLSLKERVVAVQNAWQEPIPRLLIFDNCEDELLAADWLPTSGGCSVLLTSRRGAWPLEMPITPLPLAVLERASSIQLVQGWASHLLDAAATVVADAVGDLPLALQLAGHYLARHKQMTAAAYIAQLSLQHASLQGQFSRYSPTGHELHVAQTFAVSFAELRVDDPLDELARQLLACIVCFAPGEPIEQALLVASLAGEDVVSAENALRRLLELGLIDQNDTDSVVMHRLLVAFTQARFENSTAQTAVEQAIIKRVSPYIQHTKRMAQLPIDMVQLQHVADTALTHHSSAGALMALAVGARLHDQGESAAAKQILERGLAVAEQVGDPYTMGRILIVLANACHRQGMNSESLAYAESAEKILANGDLPNPAWAIEAVFWQGWQQMFFGRREVARQMLERAYHMSVEIDDAYMIANTLQSLGTCELQMVGFAEVAQRRLQEALLRYQALGSGYYVATVQANLGNHAYFQGDYAQARTYYQDAVATSWQVGHQVRIVAFTIDLAKAMVELGMYAEVVTNLRAVEAMLRPNWRLLPYFYYTLAKAQLGLGALQEALANAQFAVTQSEATEDPLEKGQAWHVLGLVLAQVGQLDWQAEQLDMERCFKRAIHEFSGQDSAAHQANVLWSWARIALQREERLQAEKLAHDARIIYEREQLPRKIALLDAEIGASHNRGRTK